MAQLLFKKMFYESIRQGRKRTTIRRWDKARVSAGGRALSLGLGWLEIESVEEIELAGLTKADAVADGFATLAELRKALAAFYPHSRGDDGKRWFRVGFRLEPGEIEAEAARQSRKAKAKRAHKPPMLPIDAQLPPE